MRKAMTMGGILLEMISDNRDEEFKGRIDDIVKNPDCAELFDVIVINAMGYDCPIGAATIDRAIGCIIGKRILEIEASKICDNDKIYEKHQWTDFLNLSGDSIKSRFRSRGLLVE